MRANLELPVLAELPGPAGRAENGYVGLRRAQLESARAALGALRGLTVELRCALVTSAGPGGALGVAIGLATAEALEGRRVIVVECDLSRPGLALLLGLAPDPGLAEYLAWETTAPKILQPLDLSGAAVGAERRTQLVCVVGGAPVARAPELIASESFGAAMRKLRRAYDVVVLAGGPIDVAEMPLIARHADAIAVCAREPALAETPPVEEALSRLPVRPVGLVVAG